MTRTAVAQRQFKASPLTRVRQTPAGRSGGPPGTAARPSSRDPRRDWWVGPGPSPCERHNGLCAYTGQEPHRCPRCHRSWRAIVACECAGCRDNHRKWHDERDKTAEETRARMRAVRALKDDVK
jgi:hypothetical protein